MTRAPLAALLALAAALVASCAAPLVKLPAGPGAPAADAWPALVAATSACRAASTVTAEAGVSGSIEGARVRARVVMGLAAPASARLEARAVGQPLFTFVAVNEIATLLLDQDRGKLEGAPARDVMEALTGVPLGSRALRVALTGCADVPDSVQGSELGPAWRRIDHGGSSYFLKIPRIRSTRPAE
jgi:hypothetical protein